MSNGDLTDFEREIIRVAARIRRSRLGRCLYLATFLIPLLLILVLTGFKASTLWVLLNLLLFFWFFFVLTGIITKLAAGAAVAEVESHAVRDGPMPRWKVSLLTYLAVLLFSAIVAAARLHGAPPSQFAREIFAMTTFVGGGIGLIAMVSSYVIYAGNNRPLSIRWMTFGVDLLYWAFILVLVYGVLFAKDWRG